MKGIAIINYWFIQVKLREWAKKKDKIEINISHHKLICNRMHDTFLKCRWHFQSELELIHVDFLQFSFPNLVFESRSIWNNKKIKLNWLTIDIECALGANAHPKISHLLNNKQSCVYSEYDDSIWHSMHQNICYIASVHMVNEVALLIISLNYSLEQNLKKDLNFGFFIFKHLFQAHCSTGTYLKR